MSKRANSIGIALLAIGTINSIIALVSIEGDEVEPRRRRDAAIERVSAVYDWDELERTGWKTKEAQVASFRQVPARPAPPSNQWDCPPDATVITRRRGQLMTTEKQSFTTDKEFAALTAAASTILARELTRVETNAERKAKKQRVLDKKWDCFVRTFPELAAEVPSLADLDALVRRGLPLDRAITLLVDLAFSDPFSPYELKFKPKDFHNSLVSVASLLGVSEERVEQLEKTQKDAMRAHKHVAWGKVVLWGAGGTIVLAVGGWIAAPWIAGGIGAAAGLTGAAATAHGLAVLGGGSLALGGFGMAGGMWIVTGAGVLTGMGVFGGGTLDRKSVV